MSVSDGRVGNFVCDGAMQEEAGADKIDEGDVECIAGYRDRKEGLIYCLLDLLEMLKIQQKDSMAEHVIRMWPDKHFELYWFAEMVRLLEFWAKMFNLDVQDDMKNSFIKDNINVKTVQMTISGVLYT